MPLNTERAYIRLQDPNVSRSLRLASVDACEAPSRYAEDVLREELARRGYGVVVNEKTPTASEKES